MQQDNITQVTGTSEYSSGIESIWNQWDPIARSATKLLHASKNMDPDLGEEIGERFRRMQYKTHVAAEFADSFRAPINLVDTHDYLVKVLEHCREAFGVIAIRMELDEMDDTTIDNGLQSIAATSEAFRLIRSTPHSWYGDDTSPQLLPGSAGYAIDQYGRVVQSTGTQLAGGYNHQTTLQHSPGYVHVLHGSTANRRMAGFGTWALIATCASLLAIIAVEIVMMTLQ